jgi:predicted Rdx family selenoprotein
MDWAQAEVLIRRCIVCGVDLKTAWSSQRIVKSVGTSVIRVQIGATNRVVIPMSMLQVINAHLDGGGVFDRTYFSQKYPVEAKNRGCMIHVIGQIFVKAGLARQSGTGYVI